LHAARAWLDGLGAHTRPRQIILGYLYLEYLLPDVVAPEEQSVRDVIRALNLLLSTVDTTHSQLGNKLWGRKTDWSLAELRRYLLHNELLAEADAHAALTWVRQEGNDPESIRAAEDMARYAESKRRARADTSGDQMSAGATTGRLPAQRQPDGQEQQDAEGQFEELGRMQQQSRRPPVPGD
jgi:hypothetical protein